MKSWIPRQTSVFKMLEKHHGTMRGYGEFRCRCEKCTEASRISVRKNRERARKKKDRWNPE